MQPPGQSSALHLGLGVGGSIAVLRFAEDSERLPLSSGARHQERGLSSGQSRDRETQLRMQHFQASSSFYPWGAEPGQVTSALRAETIQRYCYS